MYSTILVLCIFSTSVLSSPVDYPIKIDLPVYDQPGGSYGQSSDVHLAGPLLAENHPGDDTKYKLDSNFITNKFETAEIIRYDDPSTKITKDGSIHLESEGLGSKTLSVKENIQHVAAGLLQPRPIVDTIKEEDKYGNTGDKFASAGRAIVGGAESISNFVNSLIAVPGSILRSITRAASEKLNAFGGKLVGL
ncbi:uncharacterized protein LOC119835869 [Zerene cesonia]|uniref:uncharacterized protein LOC119835869 n=1 Tax=Zerene cesonia TaxID=33412 RepID=UPI0018E53F0A|nr:uncharacterized protein LOC119835869 [Zerene cesonia]